MKKLTQMTKCFIALVFSFAGMSDRLQGALVTVSNFSFETPDTGSGTFSGSTTLGPSGWTVYNSGPTNSNRYFGVWDPTGTLSYDFPLPHGQQVGVVFLDDTLGFEAGLVQTLSDTLALSTTYTLDVAVGNFRFTPGDPWNFTGFPRYRIELRAGTTVLASDNNSQIIGEGLFGNSTVSFTTGLSHPDAGQALSIRLISLNGSGVEVNFDNVSLDATEVPEPSSIALLLVGGGIAVVTALRRRPK